ncbi:MAG: hypothetical protein J1F66_05435 [Clostridiales bacterium]|nr:hypothetical protein [Clostridiales bacterium]
MTRTTSIVLLSIITVLVLFLGVFSFIPSFYVSDYEVYYSPSALIQKSNGLTDSVEAHYLVELDEGVAFSTVQRIIRARLRGAYGYYGVNIIEKNNEVSITLPIRNNKVKTGNNEIANVDNILKNVVANGSIEILNSTTYSEDSVVLSQEHFRRARVRGYVNGSNSWILVEIKLTKEGAELANSNFGTSTSSLSNYFAIDGEAEHYYDYNSGTIRLYAHTQEEAKLYASYINNGTLNATFTDGKPQETHAGLGFVFLIVLGVIVLASVIFLVVRYKDLGLVAALGQLLALVIFTIFAGLVHLEMLNVFAAIGIVLAYAFMTFFSAYTFEKIRQYLNDGKTYNSARFKAFLDSWQLNLIAHGALLVLGVILWVIPTLVTAPLGNVFVYGAILSFAVTFGLNRLFTYMLSPFHEGRAVARDAKKK